MKEDGCGNGIIFSWGDEIDEIDKNSGYSGILWGGQSEMGIFHLGSLVQFLNWREETNKKDK
jgi:hypothetical protein